MPLSDEALRPYFELDAPPSNLDYLKFHVTKGVTEVITSLSSYTGKEKYNKVAKNLFLGKLPTFTQHEDIMNFAMQEKENGAVDDPIGVVFSLIKWFEFVDIPFHRTVLDKNWEDKKVKHILIPIRDKTADVPDEIIIAAVLELRKTIEEMKKSGYVHCKAGMSRSAMLCLIYTYFYGDGMGHEPAKGINVEKEAIELQHYLKINRSQVDLLPDQFKKAVEIIKKMRDMMQKSQAFPSFSDETGDDYSADTPEKSIIRLLHSNKLKNAMIHFSSFKRLSFYVYKGEGRIYNNPPTKLIRDFLKNIYKAKNENWYFQDLILPNGIMHKMANAETSFAPMIWSDDKDTRQSLRNNFIDEINNYIAKTLKCNVEVVKKTINKLKLNYSAASQRASMPVYSYQQ